jgi:signal transduction protein with GAF and PtsI domain
MDVPPGTSGQGSDTRDLLRAFTAISKALNLARPLPATLDVIAEKVSRTMGHKACAVLLANRETGELLIEGSFGLGDEYVLALNTDLKQKITGDGPESRSVTAQAFRTAMPVYAPT